LNPERLVARFGRVIKKRREEAELSKKRLAELAGLDPTYIGLLERGRRNPSLVTMARLAGALRVHLDELTADLRRMR